jgi:hypothetical protein
MKGFSKGTTRLFFVVRGAVAIFLLCTGMAMLQYPGGDSFGGRLAGYSLARNYFCDLVSPVAINGYPNPGLRWAQAGMVVLAIGLIAFWVAKFNNHSDTSNRLACQLGIVGSTIASLIPLGRLSIGGMDLHPVITLGAGIPALIAIMLSVLSAFRRRSQWEALLGAFALLASLITASIYANFLVTGADPVALPIAQKIAALLFAGGWWFRIRWTALPIKLRERVLAI